MVISCPGFIVGGQNKLVFKPDLTLEEVAAKNPQVHRGRYHPEECKALQRVAILIPHRNREKHLLYLLEHLHPFLQRQQLDYGIYIIHQVSVGADQGLPVPPLSGVGLRDLAIRVSWLKGASDSTKKRSPTSFIHERSKGNSCLRVWNNQTTCWQILLFFFFF